MRCVVAWCALTRCAPCGRLRCACAMRMHCSDEDGAFVHGTLNIGVDGMVANSLTAEEADDLKQLRKDTRLEDLEASAAHANHTPPLTKPRATTRQTHSNRRLISLWICVCVCVCVSCVYVT